MTYVKKTGTKHTQVVLGNLWVCSGKNLSALEKIECTQIIHDFI